MAAEYSYQPLRQNELGNSYFKLPTNSHDPATPSPAYVTAPASPGVLEMSAPGAPSSSSMSAEPLKQHQQKNPDASKEDSSRSLQEEEEDNSNKKKKLASKEKPAKKHHHHHQQQQPAFNAMDQKYRCCCMNIKNGVIAMGAVQFGIVIAQFLIHLALVIFGYAKEYDIWPVELWFNGAFSAFIIISLAFLFAAVLSENSFIFLVWQLFSILQIFFYVFLGFCISFQFFTSNDRVAQGKSYGLNIFIMLGGLVLLIAIISVMIWWNVLIQKCKKYFADKKKSRPMQLAEV